MPDAVGHGSRGDLERAIASLEQQRAMLGDAVVDISIASLREQLAEPPATRSRAPGERRTVLTALFADLVGFTELSRALDPEDTRDIVERCFVGWRETVERHGGVVEKYIGDAVLAVFGLHRSDEEDATRAVRAGREMVTRLAEIADDVAARYGPQLHMRVGIDTGEVVVSTLDDRGGQGFVAVGPAVNRASRLQAAAPSDGVLISDATRRHVRGRFGLEEQPPLVLKGIDHPVVAYVALAERPPGFDLEPGTGIGGVEVETVGRQLELLELQEHLADIVAESGWRVVTIVGEAGIGKSRLLHELGSWLAEQPEAFWWLRGRAGPATRHRPHGVLRDVVSTRFGIAPDDPPATVLERTAAAMESAFGPGTSSYDDAALLTRWLGFETTPSATAATDDPQTLNALASELLARYVARLSEHAPVVMLMEDLHWADDASLAWLETADPLLRHRPVLVVATARPAFLAERARWGEGLDYHARLTLGPLSRRHSRGLLEQLLHRLDDVPRDLEDQLIDHAEGNPYYLEELVSWLVDAGVVVSGSGQTWTVHPDRLGALKVPSTLLGLLQARLDSLPPDQRTVLQRAAVVGRVFWEDVVVRLADDDDDGEPDIDVVGALEALRAGGLVQKRPMSGIESTHEYLFKHALLRDVAYESQLRSHRRTRHALVAQWLIEVTEPSGRTEEVAALVAGHLDDAARPDAARWYLRAGGRAAAVFAVEEAAKLFERGLQLAPANDPELRMDLLLADEKNADRAGERERQRGDLDAMLELAGSTTVERRVEYLHARARLALITSGYQEALEWAEQTIVAATEAGLGPQVARAHLWAGKALTWMARSQAAHEELGTAIALAHEHGDRAMEADAWRYLAMLVANEADFPRALELAERARALFAAEGDLEGEGTALAQLSTTSYYLGRLEEARVYLERALPMFEKSGRQYAKVVALSNVGSIAAAQGKLALALRRVQEAAVPSQQLEDVEGTAINFLMIAEIELQLGRWRAVLEHAEHSDEVARPIATVALRSTSMALQAQAHSQLGHHERAMGLASEAVRLAQTGTASREEAAARLAQGHVLVGAEAFRDARDSFERAHAGFTEVGITGFAREALAGAADCSRRLGEHARALATIEPLLDRLSEADLEGCEADRVRLACWLVLQEAGDERADAVGRAARDLLHERAARVGDDEMAVEYLARPVARALLA